MYRKKRQEIFLWYSFFLINIFKELDFITQKDTLYFFPQSKTRLCLKHVHARIVRKPSLC